MGFCPLLEPVDGTLDTPLPVLPVGLRPGKRLDQFESIAITGLPMDAIISTYHTPLVKSWGKAFCLALVAANALR